MKQKGFTLIELLAVIVILAIIALIATPMILGVIDSSKKGALEASAYGIINAAETYYAEASLRGEIPMTSFDLKTDTLLSYKGSKPESGELHIRSDGKISIAIKKDAWCVTKKFNEEKVTTSKTETCIAEQEKEYSIGQEIMLPDGNYNVIEVGQSTITLLKQESIGEMSFDTGRDAMTPGDYCAINKAPDF